jgi:phosphatidylglycerophosphate synthase
MTLINSKLSIDFIHPIENFIDRMFTSVSEPLKNTGHTPNILTTYSLISGILSIYFLKNNNNMYFGIFYFISFIFDCFDGRFARKYKMTSKIGDYYDHGKDICVLFLFFYFITNKFPVSSNKLSYFLAFVLAMTSNIYQGCVQKFTKKPKKSLESESLDVLIYMCPLEEKKNLRFLRFFGPSTGILYHIFLTYFLIENIS